jgi:hypothetical protein
MTSQNIDLSPWDTLHKGISEFKKDNQPRNNFMKDENDNLLANSRDNMDMCKNYFSQLLNVHEASDVRQMEIHISGPSYSEIKFVTEKLNKYKSPGIN